MQRSGMDPGGLYAYDPGTGMPVVPVLAMDTRAWEDARACAPGSDALEDVRAANGGFPLGLARAGLWRPRTGSAWETAVGALVAWIPDAPGIPHAGARTAAARLGELSVPALGRPHAEDVSRTLAAWHQRVTATVATTGAAGPGPGPVDLAVVLPQRVLMGWADWVERETTRIRRRTAMEKSRQSASGALLERVGNLTYRLAHRGLEASVQAAPGADLLDGADCRLVATLDADALLDCLGDMDGKVRALESRVQELRAALVRNVPGHVVEDAAGDAQGDGVSPGQE